MIFHTDLHRFVTTLRMQLGPQLRIVPLLYEGVPELRDILILFDISRDMPQEVPSTRELRARFQSLVESVFSVLTETRLFALFLDDIHEADESCVPSFESDIWRRQRMVDPSILSTRLLVLGVIL